jgi:hypothetical protein
MSRNAWGVLAVLVSVLGLFIWLTASRTGETTQTITNTAFNLKATGYQYYEFVVPPGASNVWVDGHFSAAGGSGNDIEVYVLGQDDFVNFQNGHSASTYYNSGKVTQSSIHTTLPSDSGTYYLVFSNNFSLVTPKAVQASATLHYMK